MRVFLVFLLFILFYKKVRLSKNFPTDSGKVNILNACSTNSMKDTTSSSLIQGDIAIPIDQIMDTNQGQQDIAYAFVTLETRIWTGGHIPYTFKPFVFPNGTTEPVFSESTKNMIKDGLQHISEMVPCIKFRETDIKDEHKLIFTTQSDANHPNDHGCWSYVGKTETFVDKDGEHGQVINLGNRKCYNIGTVIHEVLHSLGAKHEQNNPNRDSYINILWDNIDPSACNEFQIADPTEFSNYHTDYDVDSIMHYALNMGSKPPGNLTTMELKDKTKTIIPVSDKTSMSITDIIELGMVYEDYTHRSCFTIDNVVKYLHHIQGSGQPCREDGVGDGNEVISANKILDYVDKAMAETADKVQNTFKYMSNKMTTNLKQIHETNSENLRALQKLFIESQVALTDDFTSKLNAVLDMFQRTLNQHEDFMTTSVAVCAEAFSHMSRGTVKYSSIFLDSVLMKGEKVKGLLDYKSGDFVVPPGGDGIYHISFGVLIDTVSPRARISRARQPPRFAVKSTHGNKIRLHKASQVTATVGVKDQYMDLVQASRSMMLSLQAGDTVSLEQMNNHAEQAYRITFCIHLIHPSTMAKTGQN